MFWHIFDIYVQTHIQYAWSFRWKRSLIHFGDISGFLVCPSSTYFPVFHREINGPSTRCQKKLLSFAATSNFHSVQKSNRVLKRKRLVTRSGKTDEKYGLWWKTNRCMFYCHEKCRKSRCGIPYNIVLNILKSIFSQRNLMVLVFSFFFLFFLALIHVILTVTLASCLETRTTELMEISFLYEEQKILYHDPCLNQKASLGVRRSKILKTVIQNFSGPWACVGH